MSGRDLEKKLRNDFRDGIERYRARYRIMHGTIFQPGIPDALILDRKNGLTFVELKVDSRVEIPSRQSLIGQMEGAQVVFVNEAWTLQAPRVFLACRHHCSQKIYCASYNEFKEFGNINLFVGFILG